MVGSSLGTIRRLTYPISAGILLALVLNTVTGRAAAFETEKPAADAAACLAKRPSIFLVVQNVKHSRGSIVVDLHGDRPEDFLKKVIKRIRVPAVAGETHICLPVAKAGWYAIAVYHDKNNNQKLDKGWFGIPKEMVGVSQNPKFRLRKPHYEEAAFRVPDDGTILKIRLHKVP